jgi:hypothetical protein
MFFAIMRFFTFNSWVYFTLKKYETWLEFRFNLAIELASYDIK